MLFMSLSPPNAGEQVPQASKYQSLSRDSDTDDDDDDDDDDDEEEEEEEGEEQGPSDGDKKLNYIEVEAVGGAPPPPRPPLPASGTGRDVEYVQLKPSVAARRGHRQRRKPASSAPVPSIRGTKFNSLGAFTTCMYFSPSLVPSRPSFFRLQKEKAVPSFLL